MQTISFLKKWFLNVLIGDEWLKQEIQEHIIDLKEPVFEIWEIISYDQHSF